MRGCRRVRTSTYVEVYLHKQAKIQRLSELFRTSKQVILSYFTFDRNGSGSIILDIFFHARFSYSFSRLFSSFPEHSFYYLGTQGPRGKIMCLCVFI